MDKQTMVHSDNGNIFCMKMTYQAKIKTEEIDAYSWVKGTNVKKKKNYIFSLPYDIRESQNHGGTWASLTSQTVKNLLAVQETQAWYLGWDDPLEKGMATYSSILAWRIPWTEEPGGLQSMGSQTVEQDWVTTFFLIFWRELRDE